MLWLAGALGAVLSVDDFDVRAFLLLGSVLLAGGIAWCFGRRREVGLLRFDGQYWSWSVRGTPQAAARAQVGLDLQVLMLLRLVEAGRPGHWLWLERRTDPLRWTALRRAVYSRAPTTAPDGMSPDASAPGAPPSFR